MVERSQRDEHEKEREVKKKDKEKGETFQTKKDLEEKGLTLIS